MFEHLDDPSRPSIPSDALSVARSRGQAMRRRRRVLAGVASGTTVAVLAVAAATATASFTGSEAPRRPLVAGAMSSSTATDLSPTPTLTTAAPTATAPSPSSGCVDPCVTTTQLPTVPMAVLQACQRAFERARPAYVPKGLRDWTHQPVLPVRDIAQAYGSYKYATPEDTNILEIQVSCGSQQQQPDAGSVSTTVVGRQAWRAEAPSIETRKLLVKVSEEATVQVISGIDPGPLSFAQMRRVLESTDLLADD